MYQLQLFYILVFLCLTHRPAGDGENVGLTYCPSYIHSLAKKSASLCLTVPPYRLQWESSNSLTEITVLSPKEGRMNVEWQNKSPIHLLKPGLYLFSVYFVNSLSHSKFLLGIYNKVLLLFLVIDTSFLKVYE